MFAEEKNLQVILATVVLLPEPAYKVSIDLGTNAQQIYSKTRLLDKGTGLHLVNKALLKKEWVANEHQETATASIGQRNKGPYRARGKYPSVC